MCKLCFRRQQNLTRLFLLYVSRMSQSPQKIAPCKPQLLKCLPLSDRFRLIDYLERNPPSHIVRERAIQDLVKYDESCGVTYASKSLIAPLP
jgi:hypothetical protein